MKIELRKILKFRKMRGFWLYYVLMFPRSVHIWLWEYCLREHTPFYTRIILSEGERTQNDDDHHHHYIAYHMPAKRAPVECRRGASALYLTYTIYTRIALYTRGRLTIYISQNQYMFQFQANWSRASRSLNIARNVCTLNTNTRFHPLSSTHVFAFTPVVPPVLEKFKSASCVLKLVPPYSVLVRGRMSLLIN